MLSKSFKNLKRDDEKNVVQVEIDLVKPQVA